MNVSISKKYIIPSIEGTMDAQNVQQIQNALHWHLGVLAARLDHQLPGAGQEGAGEGCRCLQEPLPRIWQVRSYWGAQYLYCQCK